MATRPGSGQCLLDCPEDGEALSSRRETDRKESEQNVMDSLNLGKMSSDRIANTVCIHNERCAKTSKGGGFRYWGKLSLINCETSYRSRGTGDNQETLLHPLEVLADEEEL